MRVPGSWVGWTALVVGIAAVMAVTVAHSSPVGVGLTMGFGALTAIYALWSLLDIDPTHDHWALSVVGVTLFVAPWVGGFVGDGAAWTAWTCGLVVTVLGGAAYLRDEELNLTRTVRENAAALYRRQFRLDP
jgi:hypothetical protein